MWVGRLGFDSDSDTEGWHFAAAKVLLPCWQLLSYVLTTIQKYLLKRDNVRCSLNLITYRKWMYSLCLGCSRGVGVGFMVFARVVVLS